MVSTRSRSGGVSCDGAGGIGYSDVEDQVQQPEQAVHAPASRPTPSKVATRRSSRAASGAAATASQQEQQEQPTEQQQQQQEDSRPEAEVADGHAAAAAVQHAGSQQGPQPVQHAVYAPALPTVRENSDQSSDESDAADDDDSMLHDLAASIRAALSKRAGTTTSAAAAAPAQPQSNEQPDPSQLAWRPNTGLQLPAAAAGLPFVRGSGPLTGGPLRKHPAGAHPTSAAAAPHHPTGAAWALPSNNSSGSSKGRGMLKAAAVPKEPGLAKQLTAPTRDSREAAKAAAKAKPDTAGPGWYHLPATTITDEVKQDLRLLRLRGAYDPKRHYKTFDNTKFPKHFVMGTVVDDPLEYYGGRLNAKERKATLTEQLLADAELTATRKKRYATLQAQATKWSKVKKRKTEQPRKQPSKHRSKH